MIVTKRWIIDIGCVDGETSYSMGSFFPKHLKEFLEQYDHEGSSITLIEQSFNDEKKLVEDLTITYHDQQAYTELQKLVKEMADA